MNKHSNKIIFIRTFLLTIVIMLFFIGMFYLISPQIFKKLLLDNISQQENTIKSNYTISNKIEKTTHKKVESEKKKDLLVEKKILASRNYKKDIKSNNIPTESTTVTESQASPIVNSTSSTSDLRIDQELKLLAFTFDDGPYGPIDLKILDLFSEYNGHATFFVIGNRIAKDPDTIKAISEQGSEIGNHSYSHSYYTTISLDQIMNFEISQTNQEIEALTNKNVTIARPPYGAINQNIVDSINDVAFVNWSLDTLDWQLRDAELIHQKIMEAKNGQIILLHSLYEETYEALKMSLPHLYEQGYRFVTVSELYSLLDKELSYEYVNY